MLLNIARIIGITAFILLCIFLPFIPGEYDSMAVTLSLLAQVLGYVSLLLVPVGIIWLIYELSQRSKKQNENVNSKRTHRFALIALLISYLIAFIVSLIPFANGSLLLSLIIFVLLVYLISKSILRIKQLKTFTSNRFNMTPLYLIFIPVIVVLVRTLFIVPATDFSRAHAISHSQQLIQDIETFHRQYGHYPISLQSVNKDYKPNVIGIKQYYYEPFGNAYNLFFEQFSYRLDTKEIVMYNKLDEHAMTSHDMDLLQFSGTQLELRRGDRLNFNLPQPHWKFFWFD